MTLFRKKLHSLILVGCFIFTANYGYAHEVVSGHIAGNLKSTRIVLELDETTPYHTFELHDPDRLVVDLTNTQLGCPLTDLLIKSDLINDIRAASHNKSDLRIVFDLKSSAKLSEFWLPPNSQFKQRLVIDLTQANTTNQIVPPKTISENKPINPSPIIAEEPASISKPISHSRTSIKNHTREIVVIIDPGHGGKDSGANGPHGTHEKEVVLAISKKLQRRINETPGMRAVLTRDSDYFIPLRGRLDIARKQKPDLFVAIHADAYINNNSRGASVYALSDRGASSESARWLAEKENYSELGGVADFRDKSYLVRSVLLDLSQTVTITQSLQMGRIILDTLGQMTALHHNAVEQAGFMVLKSPDIPSLLVETGFITNPYEENRLTSTSYQEQLANAIAGGITRYFWQHPPQDTAFSSKQKVKTYIVAQGETLASIAEHFGLSTDELKKQNHLWFDRLHEGQKLQIPITDD